MRLVSEPDAQEAVPPGEELCDVCERSAGASIVFLGMNDPAPGTETEYAARLEELASGLCTTVFVRNAGEFAGRLV